MSVLPVSRCLRSGPPRDRFSCVGFLVGVSGVLKNLFRYVTIVKFDVSKSNNINKEKTIIT